MAPTAPPPGLRGLAAVGTVRLLILSLTTAFSAFWLWAAIWFGVLPVGQTPYNRLGGIAGSDFVFFYPVGRLAAQGRAADVYRPAVLTETGRRDLAEKIPELVWPYPPTASMPLAALGMLPARAALICWAGIGMAALLIAARITVGSWALAPLIFLCPAAALALFTGQVSPLLLLALILPVTQRAGQAVTGVSIGVLSLKPHFGVVPGLFALMARRFREAAVAIAVLLGLAVVSALVFGWDAWAGFFRLGVSHAQALPVETPFFRLVSIYATAASYGVDARLAIGLHAIAALIAVTAGFSLWRNGDAASTRALGYTGAVLLVTPYVLDYDLAILALPWMLMINEARSDAAIARERFALFISVTMLAPVGYLVGLYTNHSVGGVLLLVILMVAYRRRVS